MGFSEGSEKGSVFGKICNAVFTSVVGRSDQINKQNICQGSYLVDIVGKRFNKEEVSGTFFELNVRAVSNCILRAKNVLARTRRVRVAVGDKSVSAKNFENDVLTGMIMKWELKGFGEEKHAESQFF